MRTVGAYLFPLLVIVTAPLYSRVALAAQPLPISPAAPETVRMTTDLQPPTAKPTLGRGFVGGPGPGASTDAAQRLLDRQVDGLSVRRHVLWGGAVGAAAGLVSGLVVRAACDSYCDDSVGEGILLHMGVGTVVGAVAGALVPRLR